MPDETGGGGEGTDGQADADSVAATGGAGPEITIRQARAEDHEAVAAFTEDTWPDREASDYLPRVFPEWVDTDGPEQRTVVADVEGTDEIAGVCQCVLLSDHEAWAQGMRVDPDYRGRGIAACINGALFDWAARRGATVCRNLVFSWNRGGLGISRAVGFEPATEFRWVHPEPDADTGNENGSEGEDVAVVDRPAAAWGYWQRSDVCTALRGLALSPSESWAVQELTQEHLRAAADGDEGRAFAVQDDGGTRAMAYRVRTSEPGEGTGTVAEYGVGAWADVPAARALLGAVSRDAAAVGADRTRVLVPETPRHVSDAAYAGAGVSEEPHFVFEADLTVR